MINDQRCMHSESLASLCHKLTEVTSSRAVRVGCPVMCVLGKRSILRAVENTWSRYWILRHYFEKRHILDFTCWTVVPPATPRSKSRGWNHVDIPLYAIVDTRFLPHGSTCYFCFWNVLEVRQGQLIAKFKKNVWYLSTLFELVGCTF